MKCLVWFALAVAAMAGTIEITIPPHVPHPRADMYVCTAAKAPEDVSYVHHFEPLKANFVNGAVHHMIVFGCNRPYQMTGTWGCESSPICADGEPFLTYAWAKQAPDMYMPSGTGFVVGGDTKYKYFVVQQHFFDAAPQGLPHKTGLKMHFRRGLPDKYAGMLILAVQMFQVPPHRKKVSVSTSCRYRNKKPVHLFAYRTHAHDIGKMVIGHHNHKEIVRHSPQTPQAFFQLKSPVKLRQGDMMTVRCNYDSSKRSRTTYVGSTHLDEMCNLYYMFISEEPALAAFDCMGSDGDESSFKRKIEPLDVRREQSLLQKNRQSTRALNFVEEDAFEDGDEDLDDTF